MFMLNLGIYSADMMIFAFPPRSSINLLLSLPVNRPAAAAAAGMLHGAPPALSPHIFALSGGAMLLPRRTVRGPHTAPLH